MKENDHRLFSTLSASTKTRFSMKLPSLPNEAIFIATVSTFEAPMKRMKCHTFIFPCITAGSNVV